MDLTGSGQGPLASSNEQGNEPSVSIKWGEFLTYSKQDCNMKVI
jgi:hypothetical protein